MTVRTRFAPSPTGYLHIGGARTALFCWLFARKHQGKFVLRVEDTDRDRSTPESVQAILDAMQWLQLDYDEGPYYQSERFDRYHEIVEQLLADGQAYRCTCSKERLDSMREQQIQNKQKTRYDGHCRDKDIGITDEPHVIRFKTPQSGTVSFHDEVRGDVTVNNEELDDLVIARTDGVPTYNFTVVCDDWEMGITHVIRGDDHINNTLRQIHILNALGAPLPTYAHLPSILGDDGKRLSKRHGAASVMQYRADGYLADALINYLVRLGWSHGDQEIFTRDEMIEYFDMAHISKGSAAINPEKLDWINQQYLKSTPLHELAQEFSWHLRQQDIPVESETLLHAVLECQIERAKTLTEITEQSRYFFMDFGNYDDNCFEKFLNETGISILEECLQRFSSISDWQRESIHQVVMDMMHDKQLKLPKIAQPLRVAVTGGTKSPSIDLTLALIGKDRVINRIEKALKQAGKL